MSHTCVYRATFALPVIKLGFKFQSIGIQDSLFIKGGIQDSNLNPRKMVGIQDSNLVFKGPSGVEEGWLKPKLHRVLLLDDHMMYLWITRKL